MASKGGQSLAKEDTKQEHPLQAVVLCDPYGEEERWSPLVRTDEYEPGQETRPWVRRSSSFLLDLRKELTPGRPADAVSPPAAQHPAARLDP